MSPSRKKLLRSFAAATAVLTIVLLASEERRPRESVVRSTLREEPPKDATTLRVGLFEIGPDDVEPRLVEERIVGIDGPFRFEWKQSWTRRVYEPSTGYAIGAKTPRLVILPDDTPWREVEIGFRIEGHTQEDGTEQVLRYHLSVDWRGNGHEKENSVRVGPVVHVLFDTGSPTYFDDGWRPDFVLVTTEKGTSGAWDLERWRKAIAEGIERGDGTGGTDCSAAAKIPCPAAREALAKGNMIGDVSLARLLAGDPRATSEDFQWEGHGFLDGEMRTIWLRYPELGAFAKKHILSDGHIQAYAGPRLAPKFAGDPELAAAFSMPSKSLELKWVPGMVGFLLLMFAFVLPMLLASTPNAGRAAAWVSAGCVLACIQWEINDIPIPDLLGIPLLCAGAIGLSRAVTPRTLAARMGIALVFCVIVCQAAMLAKAPAIFSQVGALAFATLPLAVLAATDPLVSAEARVATDRTLWWYAFTNLLYPVSMNLTNLADRLLGRDMIGSSLQGWVALLVLLPSVGGLVVAAVGFWRLRRRMREMRAAPAEGQRVA